MNRQLSEEQRLERMNDITKLLAINLRNATDYLSELKRDAEALLDAHRDELRAIKEAEAAMPRRVMKALEHDLDADNDEWDEPVTLDESVLQGAK